MAETVKTLSDELNSSEIKNTEVMASTSDLTTDGRNSKQIKCHRCPSIILAVGSASLVTHKFQLPEPQATDTKGKVATESLTEYWCVDNMYAFENVGFSKTVDGVKYLICADCEIGPIGWHDLESKLSYISVSKITYY